MARQTAAQDESSVIELSQRVEAVLISTERPLAAHRIAECVGLIEAQPAGETAEVSSAHAQTVTQAVTRAIHELNAAYEQTGRAFRIELLAGGYRVMTCPAFAPVVSNLDKQRGSSRLSKPAIETLAVIAYKQPVTRAELEAIRGVSCGEVLKTLIERRLVTVKGRAEELGRPLLYGTTRQFLDHFGLATIADLPASIDQLQGAAAATA